MSLNDCCSRNGRVWRQLCTLGWISGGVIRTHRTLRRINLTHDNYALNTTAAVVMSPSDVFVKTKWVKCECDLCLTVKCGPSGVGSSFIFHEWRCCYHDYLLKSFSVSQTGRDMNLRIAVVHRETWSQFPSKPYNHLSHSSRFIAVFLMSVWNARCYI